MLRWPIHIVALLLCLTMGCGVSAFLSVGPTVDTHGNPGLDVTISGGFGVGSPKGAVLLGGFVGGGLADVGADGMFYGGVDVSLEYHTDDDLGMRASLGYASRQIYKRAGDRIWHGAGLRTDFLYTFVNQCGGTFEGYQVTSHSCTTVNVGLGTRMEIQAGPDLRGWFTFPVSLGVYYNRLF